MKFFAIKLLLSVYIFTALFGISVNVSAGESVNLKQTMKQMRLQYKEALDTRSAERFNQHIEAFKQHLTRAQSYNFSPERKEISLQGLSKVERIVTEIPVATEANLSELQQQLSTIDKLRKEYHKKAKPGTLELLLSIFK